MMRLQLYIILFIIVKLAQCCQSSTSCSSNECSSRRSSCCQGGGNNCCAQRQTLCCNRHVQTCCQDSCCGSYFREGCRDITEPCSRPSEPCNPPSPPSPLPPPSPPSPPQPSQPPSWDRTVYIPSYQPSSGVSKNVNNNSIVIPMNITVQNEIHSETHIQVPVSVDVHTVNNVNIHPAQPGDHHDDHTSIEDHKPIENNTTIIIKNVTEKVNVPFYVPIYRQIPVPYYITIPSPPPQQPSAPTGCCPVVQPCIPYSYPGCQQSSYQCGSECMTSYSVPVYQPIDVCGGGCRRRTLAVGAQCGKEGGCYRGLINCGLCQNNFYETYENFVRCSGCFVPMDWGAHARMAYG